MCKYLRFTETTEIVVGREMIPDADDWILTAFIAAKAYMTKSLRGLI